MQDITLKELLEAGCHFGHKADRWHPKATAFIYQERGGIHIIDLAKTRKGLLDGAEFIKQTVVNGGEVLFTGTKRQAGAILKDEASRVGAPYINRRWIGGLLTNWEQVHKNLEKIRKLAQEEKDETWKQYPKHERVKLSGYLSRLRQFYGGIENLTEPPKVVFIVDVHREKVAVRECQKMATPIVGIVDTNSDPTGINYVIPANDDAVGSIEIIIKYLAQAYLEGRDARNKLKVETEAKLAKDAAKSRTEPVTESKAVAEKTQKNIEQKVDEKIKVDQKKSIKAIGKENTQNMKSSGDSNNLENTENKSKKKRGRPKKDKSI